MKKFGRRQVGVMWVLMAQALWAGPANASGALAVGVAAGGAQHGFSYAINSDRTTEALRERTHSPPVEARRRLIRKRSRVAC